MISKSELEHILAYFKQMAIDYYRLCDQVKTIPKADYTVIAIQIYEGIIKNLNYNIDYINKEYEDKVNKK